MTEHAVRWTVGLGPQDAPRFPVMIEFFLGTRLAKTKDVLTFVKRCSFVSCVAFAAVVGCNGAVEVGDRGRVPGDPSDNPGLNPDTSMYEPERDPTAPGTPTRPPEEAGYDEETMEGLLDRPSPTTRAARLTHAQLANTLRDLLYLSSTPQLEEELRADVSATSIFENKGGELSVDEALWSGYQRVASELAEQVTTDDAALAMVREGTQDAESFVRLFVTRAYRRPLSSDELREHVALFALAEEVFVDQDAFSAGARLIIEAVLQSPLFLYRVETSSAANGEVIPLNSYEIASRLSYMMWNSMPDAELFAAAERGELMNVGRAGEQARRMLEDQRAADTIAIFHDTLLELDALPNVRPDRSTYPEVSAQFGSYAFEEAERFVRDVLFTNGHGLKELLTSRYTFVNDELAGVYGVEANGDFGRVELGSDRAGILTQTGFLAKNSTSNEGDPIHRGVFVARRMSCIEFGSPPDDIPPLSDGEGVTMRERVADLTEQPGTTCAGCHSTLINPFGFAFEHYTATGGFRDLDNGQQVDAATRVPLDGQFVDVSDAVALSEVLAASPQVHGCYSGNWLEFSYARERTANDQVIVNRLAQRSVNESLSAKDLLVLLVQSEAFMTRSVEELQ